MKFLRKTQLFIVSVTLLSVHCLYYHKAEPALEFRSISPSSCLNVVAFKTIVDGLPPDIQVDETKDGKQKVTVTPDKFNGKSHPQLDMMAKEIFNEAGILSSNDREGVDVKEGIFVQINNRVQIPALGYGSILLSWMTLTVIPGYNNVTETFDITVFENRNFLLKKKYVHTVSQTIWLPLLFFIWASEGMSFGQENYKNIMRDVITEIVSKRKEQKKCSGKLAKAGFGSWF